MNQAQLSGLANFIWNIADDVLPDDRDIILVIERGARRAA